MYEKVEEMLLQQLQVFLCQQQLILAIAFQNASGAGAGGQNRYKEF